MTDIEKINESLFESIKHINEYGQEYWTARELMLPLQYKKWQNFEAIIQKAKQACKSSNGKVSDHFADVSKMVTAGVAAKSIDDYHLSRYACYLIAMNGDPRKQAVALAQTYFAVKTRQQELIENYTELSEDQKRIAIRAQIIEHNKSLAEAAHNAGVNQGKEYAIFQNHGYMGLYGGLTAKDIHTRKGLKKSQKILDHMGSTELAANLFRATQTDEKLRRDNIKGKDAANQTHYEVGKAVRQTIKNLGGTMPEDLPTPEKSVKQIEREQETKLR
ncbi:MAG: DNA damage-inducible protein D [Selenomonas ruminantium]|jgi:DNA-damage-inducible protein D|uniref:DNA damage-inducible protein D n=1 Tax=Selenomonas ruminantium TaxID=971 RepID=A0A927WD14_SELRU|nr:DNA damage-inducible protein D [Selenomonas ruminantium]MBE6084398.1 DNA damage-inducible protein D [Selenomonas ruminantium]